MKTLSIAAALAAVLTPGLPASAASLPDADPAMWVVKDQPPLSCVAVGGRAVPANGGNIYDHFEVNYLFANGYRVFLANRQSTGCYNATHDYLMGTEATLVLGVGQPRIETPDGKVKWQFEPDHCDHRCAVYGLRQQASQCRYPEK